MNITGDGNHAIRGDGPSKGTSVIKVHGDFGAASAKLAYMGEDGELHDYDDGAIVSGDNLTIEHGLGSDDFLIVSGADGSTNFHIEVSFLE